MFKSYRIVLSGILVLAAGCGQKAVEQPQTIPVTGTVTYRGKAVEGAVVSLLTEQVSHAATGTTDASGKFTLSTFSPNDGAVPGSHRATIIKLDPALQQQAGEDANAYTSRVLGKDPGRSLLPAKYASVRTTVITPQVKGPGPVDLQLELMD